MTPLTKVYNKFIKSWWISLVFQQMFNVIKLYIIKARDLWSFWLVATVYFKSFKMLEVNLQNCLGTNNHQIHYLQCRTLKEARLKTNSINITIITAMPTNQPCFSVLLFGFSFILFKCSFVNLSSQIPTSTTNLFVGEEQSKIIKCN